MRILVLSWEFPPRIVGGIARHVGELYPEVVKLGYGVDLVTIRTDDLPAQEVVEGINVYRVTVAENERFFDWVTAMNDAMIVFGRGFLAGRTDVCLIHAHDWLVGDAAIALKQEFQLPLVATIHATEYGRHNGIHTETHAYIAAKEQALVNEAWRIIVCSQYMRHELECALNVSWQKMDVIFNGIRSEKKQHSSQFDRRAFRRRFAPDDQKIVYYVGRLTYEKGISVLIDAAPRVLEMMQGKVKFVIIGGGHHEHLKQQAWNVGLSEACEFTGFMPDEDLDRFQTIADCAVFPSLYEPFGIVVLESFAAKVPVVVSNAGGLSEVVTHEKTGIVTYANVASSLAWGILEVLQHPEYAKTLVENAYADLPKRFNWSELAKQTVAVFERVVRERSPEMDA
ncbi:glycosyltransferase family 4 protein [[Limnothrix rosea] IAM M-220]|uniref:glycosyltransferase family 4 protein n=1 Tax=[Limnothrix rosea] IAM M-220 TaxID=454133 RepID=UPI000960A8E3|nr:glycosyltransferase family 4 protein [[Limnothrix rosea] IAM M-220]OKH18340.1 glycoside hydrolase [[Limnothrix rosea] IAM M-220]